MSKNSVDRMIRPIVLALGLFATAVCCAHGGYGGGGYYHGGGGYYHGGGGYYHGGYHGGYYGGGGYYHGGYYGGGWGWGGAGIVIGVPLGGYGYYDYPACQTVRVCNPYGHCWLQQSCY